LVRGDTIHYLYTDASHSNPLLRVKPLSLIEEGNEEDYDKKKYREILLDAAETVLGCFGFSRTLYGDTTLIRKRKWWHTLREERTKDIETERSLG
jgi:hypothetical protein